MNATIHSIRNDASTKFNEAKQLSAQFWVDFKQWAANADYETIGCAVLGVLTGCAVAYFGMSLAFGLIAAFASQVGWLISVLLLGGLPFTALGIAAAAGAGAFLGASKLIQMYRDAKNVPLATE